MKTVFWYGIKFKGGGLKENSQLLKQRAKNLKKHTEMKNQNYSLTSCITNSRVSFTAKFKSIVSSLIINCNISTLPRPGMVNGIRKTTVRALIDTGSTDTYLMEGIAQKLNLIRKGYLQGKSTILLEVPSKLTLPIEIRTAKNLPDVDMVIGLNILSQADMIIKNSSGQTLITFEMPAAQRAQPDILEPGMYVIRNDDQSRFGVFYDTIVNRITFPVLLNGKYEVSAKIDTGAQITCVSRALAKELTPAPSANLSVLNFKGKYKSKLYPVNIEMPGGSRHSVYALESHNNPDEKRILIGMDILQNADFAVQNLSGRTVFTFRNE